MKNTKKLLIVVFVLALALMLFACGDKCDTHTDANKDGKCDTCGAAVEVPPCETHTDADNDGKCDVCGNTTQCVSHTDANNDGKCDKCGADVGIQTPTSILLYNNSEPDFCFVLEKNLNADVKKIIDDYIKDMKAFDVTIKSITDGDSTSHDYKYEILIGDVTSRGEDYTYDKHTLGKDGYVFKMVGNKVLINAGSYKTLESAVEEFIYDVLLYDEDADIIGNVTMKNEQEVLEIQEYDITALKTNGIDMRGYTIAIDLTNSTYMNAALNLQETVYDRTGYWFEIVSLDKATAKSVIIKHVNRVKGENGFKIIPNQTGELVIECMYDNKLVNTLASFLTQNIILIREGEINFTQVYTADISFLTYEEYGAKGDGVTDDFKALYNTHVDANLYGQSVKATNGATYYIKNTVMTIGVTTEPRTIPIKTDTYWGTARFTIDDRELSVASNSPTRAQSQEDIFTILSDYDAYRIEDPAVLKKVVDSGLRPGVEKLDITFDYPVMILPRNGKHTVYRRKGYSAEFQGSAMHEIIVLDENGNVDPSTPILFNYTNLDRITVYRLDIEPITIEGGIFTTRASRVNTTNYGAYIDRGLNCKRSFTTIKNVKHYVTDEVTLDEQINNSRIVHVSACYTGFFRAQNANVVTYDGCVLTGRRCYKFHDGSGTGGTYDLNGYAVNKLTFKNCTQSNFWIKVDPTTTNITASATKVDNTYMTSMSNYTHENAEVQIHWGIGGTNYCKNMEYINSTLSRFDAHAGLYNGKIKDSTVNYMAITGKGEFIVENTEWYASATGVNGSSIFYLREDYGSTWDGTITAKNLKAYVFTTGKTYLFRHVYENWYFGYESVMPNLSIDNLEIYDIKNSMPVDAGYEIYFTQNSIKNEPNMHLSTANSVAQYCYIDLDGNGYVDGTDIDVNKDGVINEADGAIVYDPNRLSSYTNGVTIALEHSTHPGYKKNINKIKPPEYIKIINNDGVDRNGDGIGEGGYTFIIPNTLGDAPSADDVQNLPSGVNPDGGFFGTTKFIWGEGENDYCFGTNPSNSNVRSFAFR